MGPIRSSGSSQGSICWKNRPYKVRNAQTYTHTQTNTNASQHKQHLQLVTNQSFDLRSHPSQFEECDRHLPSLMRCLFSKALAHEGNMACSLQRTKPAFTAHNVPNSQFTSWVPSPPNPARLFTLDPFYVSISFACIQDSSYIAVHLNV